MWRVETSRTGAGGHGLPTLVEDPVLAEVCESAGDGDVEHMLETPQDPASYKPDIEPYFH